MRSKLDLFHDRAAARSSGASSTTVGSRATEDFLNSAEFAFQRSNSITFLFRDVSNLGKDRQLPSVVTLIDHRIGLNVCHIFRGELAQKSGFLLTVTDSN